MRREERGVSNESAARKRRLCGRRAISQPSPI